MLPGPFTFNAETIALTSPVWLDAVFTGEISPSSSQQQCWSCFSRLQNFSALNSLRATILSPFLSASWSTFAEISLIVCSRESLVSYSFRIPCSRITESWFVRYKVWSLFSLMILHSTSPSFLIVSHSADFMSARTSASDFATSRTIILLGIYRSNRIRFYANPK